MWLDRIQLGFTNGVQSSYFNTSWVKDETELKWTEIDTSKTIRKVSVYWGMGYCIERLRLIDENDENIIELNWDESNNGEWITKEIPKGQEIIGLYCNKIIASPGIIGRLGFILWNPCFK